MYVCTKKVLLLLSNSLIQWKRLYKKKVEFKIPFVKNLIPSLRKYTSNLLPRVYHAELLPDGKIKVLFNYKWHMMFIDLSGMYSLYFLKLSILPKFIYLFVYFIYLICLFLYICLFSCLFPPFIISKLTPND